MRLCLSCCESVNESNSNYDIVKELLATMSYTDKPSPVLKFIPVTDKWNVWYFRHKIKTTYSYQGKYFITASRIDSKRVKSAKNQVTIFTPSDYDECHEEVEVRTVLPRCYAPPPPSSFCDLLPGIEKEGGHNSEEVCSPYSYPPITACTFTSIEHVNKINKECIVHSSQGL